MKKVVLSPEVEIALRFLDPEGVQKLQYWIRCLQRWDDDESVRQNSLPLDGIPGAYVMRTSTDIRIFFQIDGDMITVLDVAKKSAIIASGQTAGK